jgi:hypothetical protein
MNHPIRKPPVPRTNPQRMQPTPEMDPQPRRTFTHQALPPTAQSRNSIIEWSRKKEQTKQP